MDSKVLSELARAWYVRAEQIGQHDLPSVIPQEGAEDVAHSNGLQGGRKLQLEECAKQLESVIALYSPLSS